MSIVPIFICLLSLSSGAFSAPIGDLVQNLPYLSFSPQFRQYSGYLEASAKNRLHYWFVESQRNPPSDPVVLWLNGGPDCSSLIGLLNENGPYTVKNNGTIVDENVYSWNKFANVIYLEAPAGVGFSFSLDSSIDRTDDQTADDSHQALVHWFNVKFPEYKSNEFYVTGESYAGVYVPTLAVRLINDRQNFPNFKGIAIGNGRMHVLYNDNSLIPYLYYHNLVRQSVWDKVGSQCCNGDPQNCNYHTFFANQGSQQCNDMVNKDEHFAMDGLDFYNIYSSCYLDGKSTGYMSTIIAHRLKELGIDTSKRSAAAAGPTPNYPPFCDQDFEQNSAGYLNQDAVKQQIHVPSFLSPWIACNHALHYVGNHPDLTNETNFIADSGVRVLLYSGDADTICGTMHTTKFLSMLGRAQIGAEPDKNHPWYYHGVDPMIAGYVTSYAGGVDMVTVRGSGHLVPLNKPREAQQMIYNFLFQRGYSTPLPSL